MSQRTMLALAAVLTAFVLVIAGGLAGRLIGTAQPAPATAEPATAAEPMAATSFAEREAAYQATIAEANRRLELANQRLAQQQAVPQDPSAVSAAQAEALALAALPGATLARPAELVRYEGVLAYEVVLDRGTVYVDAQGAGLLANAATAPVSADRAAEIARAYRGGGEVREVEREQERGAAIFEVKFSDGAVVYVEAGTGRVAYARLGGERHAEDAREDD